ncbi:capsule biosynthesis protein CapI [Alkalispirochaeta sphaeroplastigenens]|uniref:Capsule biosynthesis protein CapI n=1 Tax=Alkalispirochaeta sphaeroplastigenens TaxID=1187066 RepID=A0A2S4JFT5_9SPIO|nr:NAD-dependent epimerase [Alkalispirochaeta sphaeroplastigenens]POQ98349.1 capsule biosynthesis protein CapI [Alkalispirochaeta sphaeroplastigenens]
MNVLVTGAAGFIGYHLTQRLLNEGCRVVGLDNLNDYYDVTLKEGRLGELGISSPAGAPRQEGRENFTFCRMDLEDAAGIRDLFLAERFDVVVHLAAQAGVRYSLTNPGAYISSNIQGFLTILEAARAQADGGAPLKHLVYASSSSVYGIDPHKPFAENTAADHPASLYAASKRSNELMAHTYSHLYGLPTTGLRFFTVYGPWGRPDMALFLFTRAILEGRPIDVFNHGKMERDFTYVDDIVEGIRRVMDRVPAGDPSWDGHQSGIGPAPCRVYNIGRGAPVRLMDFIEALETELGQEARKNMMPLQAGDVPATFADCTALERDTGYRPVTEVRQGIAAFVAWYRSFYGLY